VRNLKTNFYTYAGVVRALDGVSFDVEEGATVGLVGETGCGKSVTALSVLRLIPQPPGRIEEGEALFDAPEAAMREIETLEARARSLLPRIFGDNSQGHPADLSVRRLRQASQTSEAKKPNARLDVEEFQKVAAQLSRLKEPYDLLLKPEEEMRKIRGNMISMIFQEPMQALNPVFPIGDQIAENILLHQEQELVKSVLEKMELEVERDEIGRALKEADPTGSAVTGELPGAKTPRSRAVVGLATAWIAISVLSAGVYGLFLLALYLVPGLDLGIVGSLGAFSSGFVIGLALACAAIGTSVLMLRQRPVAMLASFVVAGIEALSRISLNLLPLTLAGRLLLLAGLVVDVAVFVVLTRSGTDRMFRGQYRGWAAALHTAEGNADRLLDLRDLLGRSRLPDEIRERLMARIDRFIERANRLLKPDEPVTGHFHPFLPRKAQIAYYRRRLERPGSGVLRWGRDKRLIGGLLSWMFGPIERPLYNESVTWAIDMLRKVKISDPERIASQYPYELSGGMQQRSLIAIALSCNPKLLIADEPTTALDVTIQAQILELIKEMKATLGSTVLIITHDLGIIAEMCDRVCVMYAGIIAEDAVVRSVFKNPLHPYTQGLMKAIPSHTVRKEILEIIRGSVPNLITPPPGCRFHPRCPLAMPTCGWSPAEVAERLQTALASLPEVLGVEIEAIQWTPQKGTELWVTFPGEAVDLKLATEWVRKAVNSARSEVAIQAVTAVEPGPPVGETGEALHVVVRLLPPVKPGAYEPEPRHFVSCLLYEETRPEPVLEGGRVG